MKPSFSRATGLCVGYVILHTLAHVSAFWFEVKPGISVSIWYPPAGLALALMVLLGVRAAPFVFLTNFATAWITLTPRVPWTAFFYPGLLTLSYAGTAWLVRRWLGSRLLPGGRRGTLVFFLAVGVAPLVPAAIGTVAVSLSLGDGHGLTAAQFARSVFDWWIGDASGLLIVVPVAMVFVAPWLEEGRALIGWRGWTAKGAALVVARGLGLLGTLVLVLTVPVLREHSAFYLCFLPLVWICVQHGLRGATLAALAIMLVGLVAMRLEGTTKDFSYIFLLFEVAVAWVGLGLGTLVTRRAEAERALAESQARLDRVISGAHLGMWELDIATGRVDANERLATMIGYAPQELQPLEKHWLELIHSGDWWVAEAGLQEHLEGRKALYEAEFRLRAKDGRWHWIQSRGSVVMRDEAGRPRRVAGTHVDINDRKRAESEARRLTRIVEAAPDFILTADDEGRVVYANGALLDLRRWTGADVVKKRPMLEELLAGEAVKTLRGEAMAFARAVGTWQGEGVLEDAGGRAIPTSQVVVAHRDEETDTFTFSFILRDISDQKRAEAERLKRDREVLQVQKAESLSVLAGGIAHDFNNLLTAILGNANLVGFELAAGSRAQVYLGRIEEAARRAAGLCQQMLAYAGRNPVAFAEMDLNRLVADVCRLTESSLEPKIAVRIETQPPLAPILAAATQMQQVVMNLLLNAAEAIGDREGTVTLRTSSRALDDGAVATLFPGAKIPAGVYTLLEVEDSGEGMTAEVQGRIFEPFFTTKFAGQGLGLAAVAGVVKSHRGAIAVRSAPGAGAAFRLAFPALGEPEPKEKESPAPPAEDWQGSGTILVVDDDALICEVSARIIESLGFRTVTAGDGVEGVEKFREHAGELTAVLLDLTMPKMDGFEAHAAMHAINPEVPVVLMSGFSRKLENLPPSAIHPAGVLPKPFGVDQLRERLAAVLAPSR